MTIVRTPTRAEGGITDDEKRQMEELAEHYINNIILRTTPADINKLAPAIRKLYEVSDLDSNINVVLVDSPLQMALVYGAAAWIWHTRGMDTQPAHIGEKIEENTRNALLRNINQAMDHETRFDLAMGNEPFWHNGAAEAEEVTYTSTVEAVHRAFKSALENAHLDATAGAIAYQIGEAAHKAAVKAVSKAICARIFFKLYAVRDHVHDVASGSTVDPVMQATREAVNAAVRSNDLDQQTRFAQLDMEMAVNRATDLRTNFPLSYKTLRPADRVGRDAVREAVVRGLADAVEKAVRVGERFYEDIEYASHLSDSTLREGMDQQTYVDAFFKTTALTDDATTDVALDLVDRAVSEAIAETIRNGRSMSAYIALATDADTGFDLHFATRTCRLMRSYEEVLQGVEVAVTGAMDNAISLAVSMGGALGQSMDNETLELSSKPMRRPDDAVMEAVSEAVDDATSPSHSTMENEIENSTDHRTYVDTNLETTGEALDQTVEITVDAVQDALIEIIAHAAQELSVGMDNEAAMAARQSALGHMDRTTEIDILAYADANRGTTSRILNDIFAGIRAELDKIKVEPTTDAVERAIGIGEGEENSVSQRIARAKDADEENVLNNAMDSSISFETISRTSWNMHSIVRSAVHSVYLALCNLDEGEAEIFPKDEHELGYAKVVQAIAGEGGLRCAERWYAAYQGGAMWAQWDCMPAAARDILGLVLEPKERFAAWEACQEGGFRCMHEKFCVVSDHPLFIHRDDNHQAHCENGPSHMWRDGWALFHWHGVRVPREWIMDRENVDPAEVLAVQNVEQRAAGAEIIGWPRMLEALDAKVIDDSGNPDIGSLIELTLPGLDQPGRFLKATCPRNGQIVEGVPYVSDIDGLPIETALAAQAWRIGDPQSEYQHPERRT